MTKTEINNQLNFEVNNIKKFRRIRAFKSRTIDTVFDFAYQMTFGKGHHRSNRTGGIEVREAGKKFINVFQGKLAELAIYNRIYCIDKLMYTKLSAPDFRIMEKGEWDDSDIKLGNLNISIKSTKFFGELLFLEQHDWNEKGQYTPNINYDDHVDLYDYFILVRIKPSGEIIMKSKNFLYAKNIDCNELYKLIKSNTWEYDIPGYFTQHDLINIIQEKHIIPQGATLNTNTKIDADNYYIQSGDLKDTIALFNSLK